jgi:hypothetical protein
MRIVVANFGRPVVGPSAHYRALWEAHEKPVGFTAPDLFDQPHDWGFHLYALGTYLQNKGIADEVEFWDFAEPRGTEYHSNGTLRVMFHNPEDVQAYLDRYGYPDLFYNHGAGGHAVLDLLEGKVFRVHVPTLRHGRDRDGNFGAECYLVDSEQYFDDRCMMYIPVMHTPALAPTGAEKRWDFIYLASCYWGKRHDLIVRAARETGLTGRLHPVRPTEVDISGTRITTSEFNEEPVPDLLNASRIAVYPGDMTSSPASMWECVAADLPIVMNENIQGGKHLVVPGVTGELASEDDFGAVMKHVLANRDSYRPRDHFLKHWDTIEVLDEYVRFFQRMGWGGSGSPNRPA